jgi:hypothetical protein
MDKAAEQFGIMDAAAIVAIYLSQPTIRTREKFKGATPGTSPVSEYLSKKYPEEYKKPRPTLTGTPKIFGGKGVRVTSTKIVGRFWARTVPVIGWGLLAYDVAKTLYDTQIEFNKIVEK